MAGTMKNTEHNIKLLESKGYKLSPVSKRNGMNKQLRYDPMKRTYWFSNNNYYENTEIAFEGEEK